MIADHSGEVYTHSSSKSSIAPSIASGAVLQHLSPRSLIRRALSAWYRGYWLSSSILQFRYLDEVAKMVMKSWRTYPLVPLHTPQAHGDKVFPIVIQLLLT